MATFFYYDANGTKQGPITPQELQDLVVQGIVTPQTPLETDTGHKGKAGQIKGLQFPKPYEPADPFSETIPNLSAQVQQVPVPPPQILEYLKEHPPVIYAIGGALLLLFILIIANNGSSNAKNPEEIKAAVRKVETQIDQIYISMKKEGVLGIVFSMNGRGGYLLHDRVEGLGDADELIIAHAEEIRKLRKIDSSRCPSDYRAALVALIDAKESAHNEMKKSRKTKKNDVDAYAGICSEAAVSEYRQAEATFSSIGESYGGKGETREY